MKKILLLCIFLLCTKVFGATTIGTFVYGVPVYNTSDPNFGVIVEGRMTGSVPDGYKRIYQLQSYCSGVWKNINLSDIQATQISENSTSVQFRIKMGAGQFRINGSEIYVGSSRPSPPNNNFIVLDSNYASIRITSITNFSQNINYAINCDSVNLLSYNVKKSILAGFSGQFIIKLVNATPRVTAYRVSVKKSGSSLPKIKTIFLNQSGYNYTTAESYFDISELFEDPPVSGSQAYEVRIDFFSNPGVPYVTRVFTVNLMN